MTEEDDRFFGSGMTAEDAANVESIEANDDLLNETEELDFEKFRRIVSQLERAILRNTELRTKYAQEPLRYAESEADLYAALKTALQVSESYEHFEFWATQKGHIGAVVGLLQHENPDIVDAALALFGEVLEVDTLSFTQEEDAERQRMEILKLAKIFEDNGFCQHLGSTLERFCRLQDEASDKLRFRVLQVASGLLAIEDKLFAPKLAASKALIDSCCDIVRNFKAASEEAGRGEVAAVTDLMSGSAEFLADLLALYAPLRSRFTRDCDPLSLVITLARPFSARDAKFGSEREFIGNVFNCLWICMQDASGHQAFSTEGGIGEMLQLVKSGGYVQSCALKTISFAVDLKYDTCALQSCFAFISGGGLRYLFYHLTKIGSGYKTDKLAFEEDLLTILAAITTATVALIDGKAIGAAKARARLLAKYLENGCGKIKQLCSYVLNMAEKLDGNVYDAESAGIVASNVALVTKVLFLLTLDPDLSCAAARVISVIFCNRKASEASEASVASVASVAGKSIIEESFRQTFAELCKLNSNLQLSSLEQTFDTIKRILQKI